MAVSPSPGSLEQSLCSSRHSHSRSRPTLPLSLFTSFSCSARFNRPLQSSLILPALENYARPYSTQPASHTQSINQSINQYHNIMADMVMAEDDGDMHMETQETEVPSFPAISAVDAMVSLHLSANIRTSEPTNPLCSLPSALRPPPSALCPPPSALCPLPSALCPLPSAFCLLPFAHAPFPPYCPHTFANCPPHTPRPIPHPSKPGWHRVPPHTLPPQQTHPPEESVGQRDVTCRRISKTADPVQPQNALRYVYMYIYICMYVCMYVFMYVYVYIYTYITSNSLTPCLPASQPPCLPASLPQWN
jgi:hypothetical protein